MAYKLTYFDIRGRAECIRLILTVGGQKFTDNRIQREDWPALKAKLEWGQMPVLDVEEKGRLFQTLTICRYLAGKLNLKGCNEWEAAKCDEYVDSVNDLFTEWAKYFFEQDADKKKKLHDDFTNTHIPKYLTKLNSIAEKNVAGGGFLVGKNLTWGDIFIADKLDRLMQTEGVQLLDSYGHLKKFKENVYAVPSIKAYVAQRPDSDM